MTMQGIAPPPLARGDALFLDFDGTLAGLQDDPDTVFLAPGMDAVLEEVGRRLEGALAILSGRDAGDLAHRVPGGLWRIGNHGLIPLAPDETAPQARASAPDAVRSAIEKISAMFHGTRVETKGPVLALHYRQAPDSADGLGSALADAGLSDAGYRIQHGKFVFEAKPEDANKGRALARMMQEAPFAGRRPVMIGDDTTDEDAFKAANGLGGLTVKVGAGDTVARYRLENVDAVHTYLKELAGT
ncbi:trehalose-phosphatase [uncultured Hyphomonas sp.]|uniref:trehalose-phosphatase n=1 Tax=uncultured Hyphomonas sp. TaxID=225298 RepID=UPI002AAB95D6|nr:trehalose-phosphatase [uncultured Hyphomonas sp.]